MPFSPANSIKRSLLSSVAEDVEAEELEVDVEDGRGTGSP
jgi:hypothetical protein